MKFDSYHDIAPVPDKAEPPLPPYYRYEEAFPPIETAREEAHRLKEAITSMIAGRLMGNGNFGFNAEQEKWFVDTDARLKKGLADWKSTWSAKGIDTETVLREIFTSSWGRCWEQVPDCHRQARVWAGIEL